MPFLSDDWAQVEAAESGPPLRTPFGDFRPLFMATLWLDRRLAGLQEVLGGERGGSGEHSGLSDEIASSRSRMLYQIQKLRERAVAAQALRREIMMRQIARACDALAPGGALQEDRIAAAYCLVHYSAKILQVVYDRIDVWTHEHQIVRID